MRKLFILIFILFGQAEGHAQIDLSFLSLDRIFKDPGTHLIWSVPIGEIKSNVDDQELCWYRFSTPIDYKYLSSSSFDRLVLKKSINIKTGRVRWGDLKRPLAQELTKVSLDEKVMILGLMANTVRTCFMGAFVADKVINAASGLMSANATSGPLQFGFKWGGCAFNSVALVGGIYAVSNNRNYRSTSGILTLAGQAQSKNTISTEANNILYQALGNALHQVPSRGRCPFSDIELEKNFLILESIRLRSGK